MDQQAILSSVKNILDNLPQDWLRLTTHRLDVYDESRAKTAFLEALEAHLDAGALSSESLNQLPTAYDYIRLGHPLSSVLEWALAQLNALPASHVISFSSRTTPLLAILRTNTLANKSTNVYYTGPLPDAFDLERVRTVYGYAFEIKHVERIEEVKTNADSTVVITHKDEIGKQELPKDVDLLIQVHQMLGSIVYINQAGPSSYVGAIQHVRRRETIAMTPVNCFKALNLLLGKTVEDRSDAPLTPERDTVVKLVQRITQTQSEALFGSSGLSMQYAIMMGLIDHAKHTYPNKEIKVIVPPNCYGGTNDQARRVAESVDGVEVLDLPVDRANNMVKSTEDVLARVAEMDAVPFIIVEIPTNPRVEVPDLNALSAVLTRHRTTLSGKVAVAPVFILDQTFCPNYPFFKKDGIFSEVQSISYVSGSKFPSGGKSTAGYCVANEAAEHLMQFIAMHLHLCDNEATNHQLSMLAEQLPSMNDRIAKAYENTRSFVDFIQESLPEAKINFVSHELAAQGFTPSVFSLDLPTKGETHEAREAYKRKLNDRLIEMMINRIPEESKYCVSYGQLKGCYWTIPATSTQGTTKEADKDYIARVSVSPDLNLVLHKQVFADFVKELN